MFRSIGRVFLVLVAGCATFQHAGSNTHTKTAATITSLETLRNRYQVLLVFSPGPWGLYCKQMKELAGHISNLHGRDVAVVSLFAHDAGSSECCVSHTEIDVSLARRDGRNGYLDLYERFKVDPGTFVVIFINKVGQIILRSRHPLGFDKLQALN